MKCLLTVPCLQGKNIRFGFGNNEFLGVQYIAAAMIKNNIDCEIINAHAKQIRNSDLVKIILKGDYNLIGISCPSQKSYIFSKELIKLLRINGYKGHIALGGFYPTMTYDLILNDINELDTIVIGEGELVFPRLVERVFSNEDYFNIKGIAFKNNNKITVSHLARTEDLDQYPFPVRDTSIIGDDDAPECGMNMIEGRFFRILAGRGCYGRCSFCSIIDFYKPRKKIYRSAKNVVDEIESLIEKYGVSKFKFNDEIFYDSSNIGLNWVNNFVNELKRRSIKIEFSAEMRANDIRKNEILKLKSVGLHKLSIGVESGVQRILDEMKKDYTVDMLREAIQTIRDCGIEPAFSFITIVPTMTLSELRQNFDFMRELGCYVEKNLSNQLNIYTGCSYEKILMDKGLLLPKDNFYDRHNYIFADKKVEHFSHLIDKAVSGLKKIKEQYSSFMDDESEHQQFYDWYRDYRDNRKKLIIDIVYKIIDDLERVDENTICYDEYITSLFDYYNDRIKELEMKSLTID